MKAVHQVKFPEPTQAESLEEALAVSRGEDLNAFRQKHAFEKELYENVSSLENLPPDRWPVLVFNWDVARESQRFTLDGTSLEEFQNFYPHGFDLGWVALTEFDKTLCHFSRRDTLEELWGTGCKHKLARMIRYLSRGQPISPPLVKPLESGEVIFQGGHHRYAAAKVAKVGEIPIHVEPIYRDMVNSLFPVRWVDASPDQLASPPPPGGTTPAGA